MGLNNQITSIKHWVKYIIHLALYLFFLGIINGQETNLSFHLLTEEHGLRPAKEYHIMQDSYGYAWIGTDDGLLRFDGKKFKKYQRNTEAENAIEENQITSICFEDSLGNLWFSTKQTISCYRRAQDDFIHFKYQGDLKDYHLFHLDKHKKLWLKIGAGELGALYQFDILSHQFEQKMALSGERFYPIQDETGNVSQLIATGLFKQPGLTWKNLKTGQEIQAEFLYRSDGTKRDRSSPTKGAFIDKDQTVWVGVYNGIGRYKLGDTDGIVYIDRKPEIVKDMFFVKAIVPFDEKHLLVAAEQGLFLFNKEQGLFSKQFKEISQNSYSFRLKEPNGLNLSSDGTIWISGASQEISFAQKDKNRFPQLSKLSGQTISSIAEDPQGRIWCSTLDSGTYVFSQGKELLFRVNQLQNRALGTTSYNLLAFHFFLSGQHESWWANNTNYFLNWAPDQNAFEFYETNFLGIKSTNIDQVNYIYKLSNGKTLVAKGLSIFELIAKESSIDTLPWKALQYLQLDAVNIIFEDPKGNIYLGDNGGRLVVIQIRNDQVLKVADYPDFGICYGFQYDSSDGSLWIAGSKGLNNISSSNFKVKLLRQELDNISDEPYYNIIQDDNKQLWLASNSGLIRYQSDTKSLIRFSQLDGLNSKTFSKSALHRASKTGEIWLGGQNGVNVFQPDSVQLLSNKPRVQLAELLVNDEPYKSIKNLNNIDTQLEFKYKFNTLSFRFFAIDFSDPSAMNNQFLYQMEGIDDEPVNNQNQGFARYPNLKPGHYTFKAWATNSDQVLNEEPFILSIRIIPPFTQTIWFYILCALAISSIIYTIFHYRLQQALKVERMRVKISSDLHDDVGGLLSGLAMQSEILELTAEEKVKPKLQRIAELSRSAMSRMRDTVWAIDARKDKLENLLDRMREHAEETLSSRNISYQIETDNINLKTNLPTDIRQNLYLIYKEAITNVAKHSNGDLVEVRLKNQAKVFEMTIYDNGQVMEKEYKTSGLGTSNMKMRAEQIGASLETIKEKGYLIRLRRKSIQ